VNPSVKAVALPHARARVSPSLANFIRKELYECAEAWTKAATATGKIGFGLFFATVRYS